MCIYIYMCVVCVCVHVCSCLSHAEIGKPSIPYTSFCGVADHGHCLLFHSGLLSFYSIYFDHAVIVMLTFPYIDIHHYSAFCNIYIYSWFWCSHSQLYCMCICFCCCRCCRWCCCRWCFCTVRHAATIPWHADPGQPRSLPVPRWSNAQKTGVSYAEGHSKQWRDYPLD